MLAAPRVTKRLGQASLNLHGQRLEGGDRLTPAYEHIRSWLGDLPGPVAVANEDGPTGFGLHRSLNASGIRCEVVAPSKLHRPSGDRVKTDARDAVHLARMLRSTRSRRSRCRAWNGSRLVIWSGPPVGSGSSDS